MSVAAIILLGAIAGFTIFLGLPLARLKSLSLGAKGFLLMLATGVLLFLLVDVTSKMLEPIQDLLGSAGKNPADVASGVANAFLLVLGLFCGLVGIVLLTMRFQRDKKAPDAAGNEMRPETLSLIIAIGIGAHNLSEGLAIGQAAAAGSLSLAWVLIIGFGLHNMTEGFGIAGPLGGMPVSWRYLFLLGIIGGGPTFLGTILGITFHSTFLFVFSLAFAAGAIIYVVMELLGSVRKYKRQTSAWGIFVGFLLGLGTDLILSIAGA